MGVMSYRRIMLKLSGEALNHSTTELQKGSRQEQDAGQALSGRESGGLDKEALHHVAAEILGVQREGVEVAVTIGGGNIWRYRDTAESGIERTVSDAMGMLATIMNAVALQAALEAQGGSSRVCSAIDVPQLAEPYLRRRAVRHLEKGRVVICAGGTGNPYFTTDSAAALRSLELNCEVLLKATNVDGVYDRDPHQFPEARKFRTLTLQEAIEKDLQVMDQAALSLCRDQKLPIIVFKFAEPGSLLRVVHGEELGTTIVP
jgi:uridylate kinase